MRRHLPLNDTERVFGSCSTRHFELNENRATSFSTFEPTMSSVLRNSLSALLLLLVMPISVLLMSPLMWTAWSLLLLLPLLLLLLVVALLLSIMLIIFRSLARAHESVLLAGPLNRRNSATCT